MTQKISPFLEGKYGWDFGESGWNSGMDENLLKFSYLFDKNVDGIVSTLPTPVSGTAYFLTTDNRIYFTVGGSWQSTPVPKWFTFNIRLDGKAYRFDGTSPVEVESAESLNSRLDVVEGVTTSLGTAAFEDISVFATQADLDIAESQAAAYTDAEILEYSQSLSLPSAANSLGFERSVLSTAITTVGGMLSAQWRNIWEYAALAIKPDPLDISTWDWQPAIQAAVDALPQVLYLPPLSGNGVYYTESPVVVDAPVVLVGSHCKRGNTPGGTRVENRGVGDCITYSSTKAIYDAGIKNLGLTATSGGSPLHVKYGAVRCHFTQLYLYSKDTNQPCVKADFSAGAFGTDFDGMYSCVFDGGEYIVDNVARTAGIIDMFANATVINENEFKNIWITQAKGRPAIRLLCTVNGPLLTNNRFSGLTFEICSGGLIQIQGTSHTKISGCSGWDTTAGYDGSLIQISGDTTKSQNRGLLIENFARVGNDPLNGSAVDIVLGYSRDTTIINHSPNSGAGAIIDASARTAVIIGAPNATVVNGAAVTFLQGGAVTAPEFSTKTGNKVRDVTGGVDLHAPAGTSGLGSVNGESSQRVYLDANTFFGGNGAFLPATDNLLNIGHTTNRFKTIYAGTGTINTSDAREKQEVRELSEAERAVAVRLKGLLRCFKFNDAVALKGEDARIHCGVIAQDVKAAFEAEGLVAERYAILCYDEWPEQEEVVTSEGEVVTPHREAGSRYGVRYEELLAFIVSAM